MRRWQIGACAVAGMFAVAGLSFAGLQMSEKTNMTQVEIASKPVTALQLSTAEKKQNKGITIHYKWGDTQPHLSYSSKTAGTTSYPGVPMNDEGNGWYSYTIEDASEADIIMSVPELEFQTSQFSRTEGEYWYDYSNGWSMKAPESYTEVTEVEVEEVQVAASEQITVHYPVSEISDAKIYYWNLMPTDKSVKWPGEVMKESDGYYSYTFSGTSKANFLFTNDKNQSDDFTIKKAGEYWYSAGKWVTEKPSGTSTSTEKPEATPEVTKKPTSTVSPSEKGDFRDETIYFLITTRFYDGDSGNNARTDGDDNAGNPTNDPSWRGDFKGLVEKLDYIKALGFSAIWITPVVENKSGYDYHGYHAYDFSKVDSRYESNDCNYQDLINAAHKKGIKIIQDVVFNHSCNWGERNLCQINIDEYAGGRSEMMMGSAKGLGMDPDHIYHHNGYAGGGDYDEYVVQNKALEGGDCFDLETENPAVYNYLVKCYRDYIKMGVDGFRIDTVKHISRLTLNSAFLPAFKEEGGDSFFMFGEVCTKGHDTWYRGNPPISTCFYTWAEDDKWKTCWTDDLATNEKLVEEHYTAHCDTSSQPTSDNAFLKGNEYHTPNTSQSSGMSAIDFQMHWSFMSANSAFNTAKGEDQYFNDSTWNVVYVDSHDYAPDECQKLRYTGGTSAWAENMALMFTFRGIPCIYYGSEVEFQAGKPIDVGATAPLSTTGRAYYGDYLEGSVSSSDYGEFEASGKVAETLSSPLSKQLIRLNKIRRAVPALCRGQYSTDNCQGGMCFKRRYTAGGEDSFACVTISGDASFSGIPGGTYVDLVSGDKQTVSEGGTLKASCSGQGNARVYVLQNDTAKKYGATGKVGQDGTFLK